MPGAPAAVGVSDAWALSGSVELRPEPFGALAYDFRTRQLSFLKSLVLVDVVRRLADSPTVGDALTAAGVDGADQPTFLTALTRLARTGLILERTP